MHELLANTIQHPNASVAVLGTSVECTAGSSPLLALALWDDGTGIIETLSEFAQSGLRLSDPGVSDTFALDTEGWEPSERFISAGWDPGEQPQDGELLVASILPGISRKPYAEVIAVDRPEPVGWEGRHGFGLHALYRSAIDAFGGEVQIRTGAYLMQLSAGPEDGPDYHLAVSLCDVHFLGNLISLRLPLTP